MTPPELCRTPATELGADRRAQQLSPVELVEAVLARIEDREPQCVAMKRRGQELLLRQLAGLSRQEELEFWRERTQRLKAWQEAKRSGSMQLDPVTYSLLAGKMADSHEPDVTETEQMDPT